MNILYTLRVTLKRISAILLRNVRPRTLVLKFLLSAYTYEHYIDNLHLRILIVLFLLPRIFIIHR